MQHFMKLILHKAIIFKVSFYAQVQHMLKMQLVEEMNAAELRRKEV